MTIIDHQSQMSGHDRSMGLAPAAACRVQAPAIVTDDTQVNSGLLSLFDDLLPVSTCRGFGLGIFHSHPQRVPSPYLRCHGRPVEHRAPGRFRVPLNSRKQSAINAVQSYLADLPKTHRSLSCVSGFDAHRQPREAEHEVPENRAFGAAHDC